MNPRKLFAAMAALVLPAACGPADVHLDPPKSGFQKEIQPFSVAKGTETQRCFFFENPSDQPAYVNKFEFAQTPGTHHMNIFRVKTIVNLSGQPGDEVDEGECWKSPNWADWPLVANSQESAQTNLNPDNPAKNGYATWQLPDGVAMKLEAHELLMLQTHYVNATTQTTPIKAHVIVNFNTIDPSAVTAEVGTGFATNQSIKVCPGDVQKSFESTCRIADTTPVTIIGANSHFHSRGDKFTMQVASGDGVLQGDGPFYTSTRWDDPPMQYGLNVQVPAGGGVHYSCEYTVPSDSCGDPNNGCCYTFGGHVETQEHCNAFIYYYPKNRDRGCF